MTTSVLNVRREPGTASAVAGMVKQGEAVSILDIRMVDDSFWGQIANGWICLDYVKLNPVTAGSVAVVTGSTLNIRAGAGVGYASVDSYKKGDVVTILEITAADGTNWGRTEKGWISLDYVL